MYIIENHRETKSKLFYQDINEQFGGYTQRETLTNYYIYSCFIRISMNNLEDIHNSGVARMRLQHVVLSGYQ